MQPVPFQWQNPNLPTQKLNIPTQQLRQNQQQPQQINQMFPPNPPQGQFRGATDMLSMSFPSQVPPVYQQSPLSPSQVSYSNNPQQFPSETQIMQTPNSLQHVSLPHYHYGSHPEQPAWAGDQNY